MFHRNKYHFFKSEKKYNNHSFKYSNTIDVKVIIINAINPAILMKVVLVNSPIILLLFEMYSIIAINRVQYNHIK